MSSDHETSNVPPASSDDKEGMWVSVWLDTKEIEQDMRRAAVECNQSRSTFMAEASVRRMREVLYQQAKAS